MQFEVLDVPQLYFWNVIVRFGLSVFLPNELLKILQTFSGGSFRVFSTELFKLS